MFTRIDHVMICVPDLAQGIDQYRKMGFNIHPGGVHPGKGTHNAIAFNQDDYVELLAVREQAEYKAAEIGPRNPHGGLASFIAAGGGIRYIVLQSDDLAKDALYRTTGMSAAARWMQEHGMPPLTRGVRNTGEHAMLATPAEACGAYIGFVGSE